MLRTGGRGRRVLMVLALSLLAVVVRPAPGRAVVGGQAAAPGAHLFMASIQDAGGFAFCGGSVVADNWVLTAAHCVVDEKTADLFVVTGRRDLSQRSAGQRLAVAQILVHPAYKNDTHDAALLRLAAPTDSPAIRLATLADDDLEKPGTKVMVAGWGDVAPTFGLLAPDEEREAELAVVSDRDCGTTNVGFDAATGVCAAETLRDSCQGDSGGPLFAPAAGGAVQIGIVSYGVGCALPGFPGVYSEVNNPAIRDWIRAQSGA